MDKKINSTDELDEMIRAKLKREAMPLTDSYINKISATLDSLEPDSKKKSFHFKYVAAIVLIAILGSSTTYATVNLYQQHMQKISKQEKEKMNKKTQKETENADSFSRELSSFERQRMEKLQKEYETDGRFPKNKIMTVTKVYQVDKKVFCFCYENSTFYLPSNKLSNEEMLQIIDFWEKREYSVQNENAGKQEQTNHNVAEFVKISEEDAIKTAKQTITKVAGTAPDNGNIKTECNGTKEFKADATPSYSISLSDSRGEANYKVEVDAMNGVVTEILTDYKNKEECVAGIKVHEKQFKK